MRFGAVCDGCKSTLLTHINAVQIAPGKLIASPTGPALRSDGPPEAYYLCDRCAAVVKQALHYIVRGEGGARSGEPDEAARKAS